MSEDFHGDNRRDDRMMVALNQKFSDFVERYDRDVGALNEWRKTVDKKQSDQGDILRDIAPAYRRGLWVVGLITCGSIGMAVKAFWSHISFHW